MERVIALIVLYIALAGIRLSMTSSPPRHVLPVPQYCFYERSDQILKEVLVLVNERVVELEPIHAGDQRVEVVF